MFKKGEVANPGGRISAERAELIKALADVGTEQGKTFLKHFVERAFADNQVAIALAKKILPDMSHTDYGDETLEAVKQIILKAANANR